MARLENDCVSSSASFVKHRRVNFGGPGQNVSLLVVTVPAAACCDEHHTAVAPPPVCCVCLLTDVSVVSEFYAPRVSYFLTSKYISKVTFFPYFVCWM